MAKIVKNTTVVEGDVPPNIVIADEIKNISEGIRKLRGGRLNDKAIQILVSKASNMSMAAVKRVMDGMESLESQYLRK